MKIRIDFDEKKQVFSGFGVSGAWWAQDVGGFTGIDPESGIPVRERVARLLFDKTEGIGINRYRYNLGAGSRESGKGNFSNPNRRAECFETFPGVYDWNRDANAVWMMTEAARLGVDDITLFVNSPLERFTKNGKAHLDKPGRTNLPKKAFRDFADYVLDAASHFIGIGLPVKYVSPVNEPVWVWTGSQEGCHYRPWQVYSLMKVFSEEMKKRPELNGLKLSGAENGDIRWFNKVYSRIMLSKKIRPFADAVDFHSYFLPVPGFIPKFLQKPLNDRLAYMKRYKKWLQKRYPDSHIRVSEWCHMRGGRDKGMDSALEQAKVMAEDIGILDVTAWELWIALSNYDYCDGLIYYGDDGSIELTKRYYAFGNFSKFIKKGAVRVKTECPCAGVYTLAFLQESEVVLIVINPGGDAVECETDVTGSAGEYEMYVTDADNDLTRLEMSGGRSFTVGPGSVNTLVIPYVR